MDSVEPGCAHSCGATTGNGTPCRRPTIRGGTRCTLHGLGTPQARRVAEEMLARLRVPAIETLYQIIEAYRASACTACGRSAMDPGPVIRAAISVLDRTGLGPNTTVTVTDKCESLDDRTDGQLVERGRRIMEVLEARRLRDAMPTTGESEAIDVAPARKPKESTH